jgi:hypothetical protein
MLSRSPGLVNYSAIERRLKKPFARRPPRFAACERSGRIPFGRPAPVGRLRKLRL